MLKIQCLAQEFSHQNYFTRMILTSCFWDTEYSYCNYYVNFFLDCVRCTNVFSCNRHLNLSVWRRKTNKNVQKTVVIFVLFFLITFHVSVLNSNTCPCPSRTYVVFFLQIPPVITREIMANRGIAIACLPQHIIHQKDAYVFNMLWLIINVFRSFNNCRFYDYYPTWTNKK